MTKITVADLHIHTNYSFDSNATMQEYCQAAIERGVDILCFTDHIECNPTFNTLTDFQFARRAENFHKVKQQYPELTLLLGFEFGEPHLHEKELQYICSFAPDMVIGSIHYPLAYSSPDTKCDRRQFERLYLKFVYDMVSFGGIDVVGHIDMMKRYHSDFVADEETVARILEKCVANNIVPEVNVSSLYKGPNAETMPSLSMIDYYRCIGGKYVTVNSDSHSPSTLGREVANVTAQLPTGIRRCYFRERHLVELD